ncbi:unnamed protein product [Malassezia sympodialis ATCC 42132]|uniref:protein-tyrosine-phosphatase n=1 Tax=Malassezia sympodialis (strain ATCC 42132) TaxID=1230383 RepID=M5ED29_MALS4|nr:uncharacterized protein MSY001_3245 [Malassezia sympodialis ATCC 42132]CCV00540.1 unnamed protein product [Malassezia sympodialis ATCC 42132]SHO76162.1 Similar to S.cerevisiae protein SDP1 (Stress-inducible dual-specificity MAP kinase phosphatase) [Malassezia sympodialis ATCC 42132]|eukprot:XP_018741728.1 uncharacterized protein MSY001_3245 [Malassezia sympodialis ATCC 42132]
MEGRHTLAPAGSLGIAPEALVERLRGQPAEPVPDGGGGGAAAQCCTPLSLASLSLPSSPRTQPSPSLLTPPCAPLDLASTSAPPCVDLPPQDEAGPGSAVPAEAPLGGEALEVPPFRAGAGAPVLLLDTRPSHIFRGCERTTGAEQDVTGHLQGAINLQVPTLLLRRTQRALSTSPELLDTMDFAAYIHSDSGVRRLRRLGASQATPELGLPACAVRKLMHVYWFLDVVVLHEDDASAFAAFMLLRLLAAQRARAAASANDAARACRGGLYYVAGGMRAVRHLPASHALFCVGDTPADPRDEELDPKPLQLPPASLTPPRAAARGLPGRPTPTGTPRSLAPSMERRHSALDVMQRLPLMASLRVSTGPTASVPEEIVTAREACPTVFDVSTIIPGLLYVGPDVQKLDDVQELERLGVRAVLNTAVESDDTGEPYRALRAQLAAYRHLPMRDAVEAADVQASLSEACAFIDGALAAGQPTYVHCRAGKSRSTTCVMAYLIQARSWTLQQAYAFVASQRKRTSPNIGFIAELMQFERATLGTHTASVPLSHHSPHDRPAQRVASSPTCSPPVP